MQAEIEQEVKQLSATVEGVLQAATEYKITTPEAYTASAERLRDIKGIQKKIEDAEKSITKPMNDALKAARDLFRAPKAAADKAESLIKAAISDYQAAQRRIQAEAQRKADEDARKERERLAKLQGAAEKRGDTAKAETFQERAAAVVAPVVIVAPPKAEGVTSRTVWKFEVMDAAKVPREYLVVDESRIRKVVQALKSDCNIPGVRVYSEEQIAASAL